ncbi:hypothetical protein N1851_006094 [Merluccius polli]|uniref:Uncharacterized protein n=1 Tax=Merluccius polli TaxID=89951 RepID=A0AA47P645_MERPO|nr:hypothetical protein N1851_006094 [Merluccius polli]
MSLGHRDPLRRGRTKSRDIPVRSSLARASSPRYRTSNSVVRMGPDRPRSDMPAAKRFMYKGLVIAGLVFTMLYTVHRQLPDRPTLTPPPYRPPPCLCPQADPGREKVPLVDVKGTHTLLISAYLDLRKTIREVRIIAVALRSEQAAYRCHLCCQGQRHNTIGNAYVHKDHFEFDYGTMDIFCLLPAECPDPSHVAVSVVEAPAEKELRYLEVQNREPISDDFPHDFTVCISTMFDFSNVLQVLYGLHFLREGSRRTVGYRNRYLHLQHEAARQADDQKRHFIHRQLYLRPPRFLAPVILPAKLLLKDLCEEQHGWDENIGEKHADDLKRWIEDVNHLSDFHVNRCLKPSDFGCTATAQLHTFLDASEYVYGTKTSKARNIVLF